VTKGAILAAWLIGWSLCDGAACAKRVTAPAAAVPAAPDPAPAVASCAEVGATVKRLMLAPIRDLPDNPEGTHATAERRATNVRDWTEKHCIADSWSTAARTCIAGAKEENELERCDSDLTKEQQEKLGADMKASLKTSVAPAAAVSVPSGPIVGETGVPACDAYVRAVERFVTCDKVPQEARDAQLQAYQAMKGAWATLREPGVPPEALMAAADGCRTFVEALTEAAKAAGCSL